MGRKYTNVKVWDDIYCSSTGCHVIDVTWLNNGKHEHRSMDIDNFTFDGHAHAWEWNGAPWYLKREICLCLKEMLKSGDYQVYEHDRDKNKRYHQLRYHDEEIFRASVNYWILIYQ